MIFDLDNNAEGIGLTPEAIIINFYAPYSP